MKAIILKEPGSTANLIFKEIFLSPCLYSWQEAKQDTAGYLNTVCFTVKLLRPGLIIQQEKYFLIA